MSTLMQASNQWSSRPEDERFKSLTDLHAACAEYHRLAAEAEIEYEKLRVRVEGDRPVLVGTNGNTAEFTHYSFGQLSNRVGAPASYLRNLPAALAVQNLNHGLANINSRLEENEEGRSAKLLFRHNGQSTTLRAATSDKYTRIWNDEITSRLIRMVEQYPEWQPAPAAFDGSRGLYASDHDMFAFMVNNSRRIFETDPHGGLGRGFFVSNSEVGAAAFVVTTFMYEFVCGNHRVWGAKGVAELRVRHIGNADTKAFDSLAVELRKYADSSVKDDEAKIVAAKNLVLGANKDEVLDKIFGLRINGLSRRLIGQSYDLAEKREDWYGNPRSAWGMGGAITEIARDLPHADERVALERASGKIMQLAF